MKNCSDSTLLNSSACIKIAKTKTEMNIKSKQKCKRKSKNDKSTKKTQKM